MTRFMFKGSQTVELFIILTLFIISYNMQPSSIILGLKCHILYNLHKLWVDITFNVEMSNDTLKIQH
jgi:hypothetical protein